MNCIKCGQTIPDGSLFCNHCGAKQETRCPECGAVLPAGSRFCNQCGAAVNAQPKPAAPSFVSAPAAVGKHVYGCSEKQGEMVYVSGKGLYYLSGNNLYYVADGETKRKNLTRYLNRTLGLCGLNYYNGGLYFNRRAEVDEDEVYSLVRYDIETGEKSTVVNNLPFNYETEEYNRMIVRDGLLYYIYKAYNENCLVVINLDSGTLVKRDMPILRPKDMCDEWKNFRQRGDWSIYQNVLEAHEDKPVEFAGLYLHGDYGYAVVHGTACFNIRFHLNNPDDFDFLPPDSCSAYKDQCGMISIYNDDTLVGTGVYENVFSRTPIDADSVGSAKKQFNLVEYAGYDDLHISFNDDGRGWWRVGSRYFINQLMIDMETLKYQKLPFALHARDFHELPDGRVYIRGSHTGSSDRSIYLLPANCWDKIRMQEELEKYRILSVFE